MSVITRAKRVVLRVILFGLAPTLTVLSWLFPALRAMLRRHDAVTQIQLQDGSIGRHFIVRDGKIRAVPGLHPKPDVVMMFKDVDTALTMMQPEPDMGEVVHAAKNFKVRVLGSDALGVWWMQTLNFMLKASLKFGVAQKDGTVRYTTCTNGGPLFVYVRDGRIVRITPIEFDSKDAASWTIQARGREFTPRRQSTVAPHGMATKSTVYSDRRLLYPMKRVDFDPNGERNPQNRGISKY
ncbi:MAG: pyrogallol hydroxytransferase large subunit, partial [Gammaproteobacteria bacterium]|nr:pyrogallol hydroxytransferase large subunit [Gammaproteobacteria bacterium]